MSLYIALACILAIAAVVVAGYAAFSAWFDARYPEAATERARADMEIMLQRANQEIANRPRVRDAKQFNQEGE